MRSIHASPASRAMPNVHVVDVDVVADAVAGVAFDKYSIKIPPK